MSEQKVIWLATANPGKVKEFKSIFQDYEIKTLADLDKKINIVEDGKSFEENALIKAKKLAEIVNAPAIGDDSGLEITKMDNWPGIYSKRWALPETDFKKINEMLLDKMKEKGLTRKEDRGAAFVTVIAYYDPKTKDQEFFNGKVYGTIADKQMGEEGFGYDPIFIPNGYNKTYAQMGQDEKNKFSHRKIAISEFNKFLELHKNVANSHRRLNVVLYEPEIAQNTAAIMRTCVAFGARLHIIEPLGFILNEHNMSRASANEYKKVEMIRYDNWEDFEKQHPNTPIYCLSRYGQKAPSDFDFADIDGDVYLMFGKESTGIPKPILYDHFDTTFRLPMTPQTRSINLASTVAITVCEVLRQWDWLDLAKTEVQRGADYIMSRRWRKRQVGGFIMFFKNNLPYVLSDLDGTISKPDFSVLDETKKDIIDYQKKSGYRFGIITGRDYIVNKELIHELKIQLPIISCNGALIVDPNSGKVLDANYIDIASAISIFRKAEAEDLDVIAFTEDAIVGTPNSDRIKAWANYRSGIDNKKYQFDIVAYDDLNKLADAIANGVIKPLELVVMASNKEQDEKMREIFKAHEDTLDLIKSQTYMFSAVKKGINKGTALKKWGQIINVEPRKVYVFGDNDNDISMFKETDFKFAVGNAVKELKDIATKTIDTIDNNGVGKELESILNNDK